MVLQRGAPCVGGRFWKAVGSEELWSPAVEPISPFKGKSVQFILWIDAIFNWNVASLPSSTSAGVRRSPHVLWPTSGLTDIPSRVNNKPRGSGSRLLPSALR